MSKKSGNQEAEEELRAAFRIFDPDKSGYISGAVLRNIVTTMGDVLTDEEVAEFITDADTDGSGQINYESNWFFRFRLIRSSGTSLFPFIT